MFVRPFYSKIGSPSNLLSSSHLLPPRTLAKMGKRKVNELSHSQTHQKDVTSNSQRLKHIKTQDSSSRSRNKGNTMDVHHASISGSADDESSMSVDISDTGNSFH